jgi:tetratricopeptide (TPR) repeat protein
LNESRDAALRPLHGAWDARSSLREGIEDPEAERSALLRVGEAIESSLRRLLRNDPSQPAELRLQALAPDELSAEDLITALRKRDRISIELAAAFHELLQVRRRLLYGGGAARHDVLLALRVADQLEREALSGQPVSHPPPPPAAAAAAPSTEDPAYAAPRTLSGSGRGVPWWWALVGVASAFVFALGLWWATSRPGPRLDEAIALFRTGDYDRAAAQFEQHAQARPDDPTPRLYLARIHRRLARYEEAREQLRLALDAAPDDPALHREVGFLLLDVGQAGAAVGRFRAAVERDPNAVEGWMGLVRALRESGQGAAADRVLERAPAEVRARIRQGGGPVAP